jgi:hypothetical protein
MTDHAHPRATKPIRRIRQSSVWRLAALALCLGLLALVPSAMRASDHADPLSLDDPEANITDLFFFPKGDQMILIFNVRKALLNRPPYNLTPYDYVIHMDLTSPLKFGPDSNDKEEERARFAGNLARYGGTVLKPEGLHDDVTITLHLNDDTSLKDKSFKGLKDPDRIRIFTGVRNDPFIFPRFFNRDIIAMVMSIPMSSFPDGQRDFILWTSTYKSGKQLDHHGRSNRTQQIRFDALNTLPPQQHVAKIMEDYKFYSEAYNFLNGFKEVVPRGLLASMIQLLLLPRKYDMQPDVMIYSTRFKPGYPNGRLLTDDVGAITCAEGDCILQELSFIEGVEWPRQTTNFKPVLDDWPFLAEPVELTGEKPPPSKSIWPYVIGIVILNLIVSWIIVEILRRLVLRAFRRRPQPAT